MLSQDEFQRRYQYEIAKDRLGEGGFGEVFKAYDTFLDRWVAIKVSKVKADFPELRLRSEVELVNKLPAHPNIARYEECYTFGTLSGEYDFAVLQYYELGNLLQLIKKQSLSIGQKYFLLSNLLEGIRFIHEQDIIHRDLKPQNILIVNREDNYVPKITDFGISKKVKSTKGTQFSNSLIGAGTISYAAPEQLADQVIRKNTDLWSFGVIAFQVLTGNLPFNSGAYSTSSELGRQEILKQINSGKLPLAIDLVPVPWKTIIEKCLVTDPEKRVKDVEECIAVLSGKTAQKQLNVMGFRNDDDDATQISSSLSKTKQKSSTKAKTKINSKQKKSLMWGIIALCALLSIVVFSVLFFQKKGSTNDVSASHQTIEKKLESQSEMPPAVQDSVHRLTENEEQPIIQQIEKKSKEEMSGSLSVEKREKTITPNNKTNLDGRIEFPNGDIYTGSVRNGKMHGKGKYWYKSGGAISVNDPMGRQAGAGDYIEGDWINGELYKGYHYDRNGVKKERILLGRN